MQVCTRSACLIEVVIAMTYLWDRPLVVQPVSCELLVHTWQRKRIPVICDLCCACELHVHLVYGSHSYLS
jgi:hypothetical protein